VEIGALIVDDQQDMQMLIKMVIDIANEGLFVKRTVSSGSEAIDVVDDVDPTVIVLDEMMPGLSGVQTAALLRRRRPGQLMILCSAYLDEDVRVRAAEAGIRVCVAKDDMAQIPQILRELATRGAPA